MLVGGKGHHDHPHAARCVCPATSPARDGEGRWCWRCCWRGLAQVWGAGDSWQASLISRKLYLMIKHFKNLVIVMLMQTFLVAGVSYL